MKEDNLGFPAAIMVCVFIYTALFLVYNFGYGRGKDSAKCLQHHGYKFQDVRWFAGVKK